MGTFLNDEEVPPMPAVSIASLERLGQELLSELFPAALLTPAAIDVLDLADHKLQRYDIHVVPVDAAELPGRHAATDPVDRGRGIEILVEQELFDGLVRPGRAGNMARGTVLHEVGHAILHVPVVRAQIRATRHVPELALNRMVRRDSIPPYRDPEWQAWTLAGCIAAPRAMIEMTGTLDAAQLGDLFGISSKFMKAHLRRLKMLPGGV